MCETLDFIEKSFPLHGRSCRTITIEADIGNFLSTSDVCEIVKFHGDLNHPEQMVLSESDYEKRLLLSTAMDYRLRADILGRVLLFIGYSFRDWNVSYLFRIVNDQFRTLPNSQTGRRAYITVPDPSDFEIRLFRRRNIEVIPVSSKSMTHDIALLLEEIRG